MKKKIFSALLFLGAAQLSYGSGYQVLLQGARQAAMGNMGVGLRPDGASLFFNPGAMGMLNKNSITFGGSYIKSSVAYQGEAPSNYSTNTISPAGTPFYLYGIYAGDSTTKFKAGLGVFTPFGSTVQYEENWIGQYVLQQLSLKAIYIQPTVSYRLSDKLSVGAGFDIAIGSVNLQKALPVYDTSGKLGKATLDGSAKGFGFNAGVYFVPSSKLSIGINYRSKVMAKVDKGDAIFSVAGYAAPSFPNTTFTASLPLPSVSSAEIAFYPNEKMTIGAGFTMTGWSAYKSLRFDYAAPVAGSTFSEAQRAYKDAWTARVGFAYKTSPALELRAGAYYDTTPVQAGYLTPETPDSNALGITAGFGYTLNDKLIINGGFLYVNKAKRMDTGEFSGGLPGTFKAVAAVTSISLAYQF